MTWSWPGAFVRTRSLLVGQRTARSVGEVLQPPSLRERVERAPLAMEDYAELVVELCSRTDVAPSLLARFGIASHAELERVQADWAARLAADAQLRARFLALRDELVGRRAGRRVLELTFLPAITQARRDDE